MHLEERERERERERESERERDQTCFLVTCTVFIRYVFPENLIEILRVIQKI